MNICGQQVIPATRSIRSHSALILGLAPQVFFSMPTCFQHFCAEWRRARRVVLLHALDLETKRELAAVLAGDHVVGCDGPLAEKLAADLLSNELVC